MGSRPSFTICRALAANSRATASDTSASAPKPISRRLVSRLKIYTHLVGRPSVIRRYRPPPSLYNPGLERVSTSRALSLLNAFSVLLHMQQIGIEAGRERGCQYVYIWVLAALLENKNKTNDSLK